MRLASFHTLLFLPLHMGAKLTCGTTHTLHFKQGACIFVWRMDYTLLVQKYIGGTGTEAKECQDPILSGAGPSA